MELMIYLATDNQPFSMCDSIPFQRLLAHFDSRFKVKSGACMARFKLPLLYRNLQMAMKSMFDKELPHCNRVAISTDIWISRNNDPFMAVTLYYITKEFVLRKVTVGDVPFPGKHTGQNIATQLDNLVKSCHSKWSRSGLLCVIKLQI